MGFRQHYVWAKKWYSVDVYEKNSTLGWRASVLEDKGFRWDMGPSWYLMPDVFREFYEMIGERVEDHLMLTKLEPSYRLFFGREGDWLDVYSEVEKNRELFDRLEPNGMQKFKDYLKQSTYQYEIAMKDFVWKRYESVRDFFSWRMMTEGVKLRVFERMDKYVKRTFESPEMQKIVQYPLVFLGTAPKDAPALYNIMTHVDFGMGVFYPQWGIYAIIESLVAIWKKLWVQFHTDHEVKKIVTNNKHVTWIEIEGKWVLDYDTVISNADLWWTETKMLDSKDQSYKVGYRNKRTMAPSGFIIYAGISKKIPNLDHHTLYFSDDRDKNFGENFESKQPPTDPSLYICCPSKTDSSVAPEGKENIFVLVPFPPGVFMSEEENRRLQTKSLGDVGGDIMKGEFWP